MAQDFTFLNLSNRDWYAYEDSNRNQIYKETALLSEMTDKGRKADWEGGDNVAFNVVASRHTSTGRFRGNSPINGQPANPLKAGSVPSANFYATLNYSFEEMIKNKGASQQKLADIRETLIDNARLSLKEDLANDLYSDGTVLNGEFNRFGALQLAVSATGTYAGINRATAGNEFWQSTVDATVYTDANLQDPTSAGYIFDLMQTASTAPLYGGNGKSQGGNARDLFVMPVKLFNMYANTMRKNNLLVTSTKDSDVGFDNNKIKFQGITVMYDHYCTAKNMFALSTSDWRLHVAKESDFSFRKNDAGNVWSVTSLQYEAIMTFIGQLYCRTPRNQYRFTNLGS